MNTSDQAYIDQIKLMAENARKWRKDNPTKEALINFNFPPKAMVVAPISNAVDRGFVRVNEAGKQLIAAMWPQDLESEPSVLMVKIALELPEHL